MLRASAVAVPMILVALSPLLAQNSPTTVATVGDSFADAIYLAMKARPDLLKKHDIKLVRWSGTLIELSFRDHGKVALAEAIRQLDANPTRIAADMDLVAAKRNLCFLLESSRDSLAQFELIKKEPKIVQADPHLAIAVAEGLISKGRFEEAAVVFAGIDQVPFEVLAEKLAGISGAIDGVNA
jgi:hypothetical protein